MEQTTHRQMSESFRLGGGAGPDRRLSGCVYLPYPGWSVRQRPDRKYRAAGGTADGGDWGGAGHYLVPILAFAAGVLAAELIRGRFRGAQALHWRQITVAAELLLLAAVAFLPCGAGQRGQCVGGLCLRGPGGELPQGQRQCLCHHYVHRKPAQRHGAAVPMGEDRRAGPRTPGGPVLRHYRVFHRRSGTGGLVQRPVGAEGGVGGPVCSFWRPFAYVFSANPLRERAKGYKIRTT